MRKMATSSEHTPLGQLAERYWVESRRPLASLVFIAPLLIVYEAGVLLLGVQNGADAFLRRLLELLGFGQHFLLPLLTVCILLGWHYLSRQPWQLSGGMISAMAVESLLLGVCLRVISFVQDALVAMSIGETVKESIGFLGAGIYEELLFRLILLSLLAWALRHAGIAPASKPDCGGDSQQPAVRRRPLRRAVWRIASVALLPVSAWWRELFFAILFLYRGYGIAAGSHAAYDNLVRLV